MINCQDLAAKLSLQLSRSCTDPVTHAASLHEAQTGAIVYIEDRFQRFINQTNATLIVTTEQIASQTDKVCLISKSPRLDFARALKLLYPVHVYQPLIHPSASIDEKATIDPSVHIGPNVVIESGVSLAAGVVVQANSIIQKNTIVGKNTLIGASSTIYPDCQIGAKCFFEAGVVIGAAGFGYVQDENKAWMYIEQISHVIIEDDVYLGANTTIDRGAVSPTRIHKGVKIDNQSQIGHGVNIGEHTIISGCVGIGGSTAIGAFCMIGGAVNIRDNIEITDHVMIAGASTVGKSVKKPGFYCSSMHVMNFKDWIKNSMHFAKLSQYFSKEKVEN